MLSSVSAVDHRVRGKKAAAKSKADHRIDSLKGKVQEEAKALEESLSGPLSGSPFTTDQCPQYANNGEYVAPSDSCDPDYPGDCQDTCDCVGPSFPPGAPKGGVYTCQSQD